MEGGPSIKQKERYHTTVLDVADRTMCLLADDLGLDCFAFGDGAVSGRDYPHDRGNFMPNGAYTSVGMGPGGICATRLEGHIRCWNAANAIGEARRKVGGSSSNRSHDFTWTGSDEPFTVKWWSGRRLNRGETDLDETDFWFERSSGYNLDGTHYGYARFERVDSMPLYLYFKSDGVYQKKISMDPPSGERFVRVDVGKEHACAITSTGKTRCWGNNNHGQTSVPSGLITGKPMSTAPIGGPPDSGVTPIVPQIDGLTATDGGDGTSLSISWTAFSGAAAHSIR